VSSYIVEDNTINKILSYIAGNDGHFFGERLSPQDLTKLGRKLLKMNAKAVGQRYNEPLNKEVGRYVFSQTVASRIEALKALHCYRYQCSEGTVPRQKLYKDINSLIHSLENKIVHRLPEYEKATWG